MFRGAVSILAGEALVFAVLATVAADLAAHKRVENAGGLNIRGYRGPVAHQRQPNELRIVFVGGTRAFGWGEPASSTAVAAVRFELSRVLDVPSRPLMPIVAINLGQIGAHADSYAATLNHFSYLKPDYICIFDDLGETGPNRPFEPSGVFALTGYQPMLPLVLQEKGRLIRTRAVGAPLEFAGDALAAADRALARVAGVRGSAPALSPDAYAEAMMTAIETAHRQARGVVVVLSPLDTEAQRINIGAFYTQLLDKYPGVRWLQVEGLRVIEELRDPALRLDGFSFGANASSIAARAIAPDFLELIRPR